MIVKKNGSNTKSNMDMFGEAPMVSKVNESRHGAKFVVEMFMTDPGLRFYQPEVYKFY